jgi:hypothetical protein
MTPPLPPVVRGLRLADRELEVASAQLFVMHQLAARAPARLVLSRVCRF